jgi:hypothetical protein
MVQKIMQTFVYPPEQQAQFEQLQAEIDRLLFDLLMLKQQQRLKPGAVLNSPALSSPALSSSTLNMPSETLAFSQG